MNTEFLTSEQKKEIMDLMTDGMSQEEAYKQVVGDGIPQEEKKFACKDCGKLIDTFQSTETFGHTGKPLCKEHYAGWLKATGYDPIKPGLVPDDLEGAEEVDDQSVEEQSVSDIPDVPDETSMVHEAPTAIQKTISHTIKGMTPMLCESGKIKIGRKGKMTTSRKGTQFRPPEKLDHFVVVTTSKDANGDFIEDHVIMEKIGDNCTAIPIRLLHDNPELNFPTSYAYYDSAACQCRGDGELAQKADGSIVECDPENCIHAQKKLCKPNGVLSVILDDAPRVGGVYKFRTTGWNSIRNILSSLKFIRGLTGGPLAGLPLMLTMQPKTTVIPGTKTTTTIYMVNVEYRGGMADLLNEVKETVQIRQQTLGDIKELEKVAKEQLALPESSEECKDVQEEFYPETVVA